MFLSKSAREDADQFPRQLPPSNTPYFPGSSTQHQTYPYQHGLQPFHAAVRDTSAWIPSGAHYHQPNIQQHQPQQPRPQPQVTCRNHSTMNIFHVTAADQAMSVIALHLLPRVRTRGMSRRSRWRQLPSLHGRRHPPTLQGPAPQL